MDLSVVAVVATIAAGVSILVAVAAVFAARRSTAHADLALKEASRISRASISRINEVQSEASSARMAARHAAERLHSMTKERTTPDSVAAYRVFLREVVEDSKHLLGPEGTGTMKNEALDRLRVGALVGGSDEVLRAMRNFALLRSQRPEAPWPSAYAMAYARLEADLVTAIRNDLGSSEESLTADQIWGAVNARCVDPAFRLALLSPLEDVLRNAGQDPTHYDLDHIAKFADYPTPAASAGATGSTRAVPAAGGASTSGAEPRRRSRRTQSRVAREAPAAAQATTALPDTSGRATTGLPDSDVVWPPLTPGRRGGRTAAPSSSTTVPEPTRPASTATTTATAPWHESAAEPSPSTSAPGIRLSGVEPSPTAATVFPQAVQPDASSGPPTASLTGAQSQAVGAQQAPPMETSARSSQSQQSTADPTSHREPETRRPVFEDPTPSRISRRRHAQTDLTGSSSMQAAAVPDAVTASGTMAASPLASSVAPTSGASTASANTEETSPVFAPALPETPTGRHATDSHVSGAPGAPEEPASLAAPTAPAAAAQAMPQPVQPHSEHTRTHASPPPAQQDVLAARAAAVSAQTVMVPTGPQPSPIAVVPAGPASAVGTAGATGYGFLPSQGAAQAPAQAPGSINHPVSAPSGLPVLSTSQQAEQSSAVAAADAVPAVPADAVGAHRAAAVVASTARTVHTAIPDGPGPAVDPAAETMTVTTAPSAATAIPTATPWPSAAQSLQDSGQLPRARGA